MNVKTKELAEMLGVICVTGSLIFVGIQLMQERNIALGAAYQERAESRMENLRHQADNAYYVSDIIERINLGYEIYYWSDETQRISRELEYSMGLTIRQALSSQLDMVSFDNAFFQRSLGLLNEGYWDAVETSLRNAKANSPLAWEQYLISPVSSQFKEYLLTIENQTDGT